MTTEVGRREGKRTSQRCCSALNERTRNLFMCEGYGGNEKDSG